MPGLTPWGFGPQIYDPQMGQPGPAQQGYQSRLGQQQQYQQQLGLGQQEYQSKLGLGQQQFGFNQALQGQQLGAQEKMLGEQLQSQQGLANLSAQTTREGYQSQQQIANTQAEAAKYPATLQQQRFNQAWPLYSGALSGALSGKMPNFFGGGSAGGGGAGGGGQQPTISAAPVYSGQQIQQNVNSQRAANDQGTAGRIKNMQQGLAGQGFGSNSPLAQALGMGMQQANLAQNTQVGTQTRLGAAEANSKQVLAGQQAQEGQYASRQQEAIQRAGVYQNYLSSALAALSGLV